MKKKKKKTTKAVRKKKGATRDDKRIAIYKAWGNLVVRAWSDEKFRRRLIEDPKRYLTEQGVEFGRDVEITVVEETENAFALHLPNPPSAIPEGSPSLGDMPLMSSFGVCDDMVMKIV